MRTYGYAIFTSLILASGSFAANAAPKQVTDPGFTINADRLEKVTDNHMKASGNVFIKIENTEIKSNKMDIQVHPDKLELSDGKFKATIKK